MDKRPRLLITMGDVAGVGPEIIARAWPELNLLCQPVVVGDPGWLQWAVDLVGGNGAVLAVQSVEQAEPSADRLPCLPGRDQDLSRVRPGQVDAAAGRAAY